MRNLLNITIHLDRLICHDEGDGWGDAEPYLWPVFFKIDGTTCRLNDALMLEGTATVFSTAGHHGNLGDTDVDEGDTVTIPTSVGMQSMILTPIPVPEFVRELGTDDVTAFAGCIAIVMEEDNVTDDGAREGYNTLINAVQNALDAVIPTLGAASTDITDEQIKEMTEQINATVTDAIKSQQNFFENIWSWLNSDDTVGSAVFKFSGDDLLAGTPVALQKQWPNEEEGSGDGAWELTGSIIAEEVPSCPAEVVQEIFEIVFGRGASSESMRAMYNFRNHEMKNYKGLNLWWNIARNNSLYLKHAIKDQAAAQAALTLFKEIPEILKDKNKPLSESHFNLGLQVLNHILKYNTKDRHARKGIKRSIDALHMLKGKSIKNIFETLSAIKPARHPSVNTFGSNFKLKKNKREK